MKRLNIYCLDLVIGAAKNHTDQLDFSNEAGANFTGTFLERMIELKQAIQIIEEWNNEQRQFRKKDETHLDGRQTG